MPTREEILALQEIINEAGLGLPQRQEVIDKYEPSKTRGFIAGVGDSIANAYGSRGNALDTLNAKSVAKTNNALDAFDANRRAVVENYLESKKIESAANLAKEKRTQDLSDSQLERLQKLEDVKSLRDYEARKSAADRAHDIELEKLKQANVVKKGEKEFDNLSKDDQNVISELSKKNASKISIANQIDAVLENWDSLPDDQKVTQGRQLLKTLNSTEGADAIGSEEAKRLGQKLEFVLIPRPSTNFQAGRDLKGFFKQASDTSKSVRRAVNANQQEIDKRYSKTNSNAVNNQIPVLTPEQRRQRIDELRRKASR